MRCTKTRIATASRIAWIACALALASAPVVASGRNHAPRGATPCYSTCRITLRGIVEYETTAGPPGFGDDPKRDVKLHVPVLRLDTPLSVGEDRDFLAATNQTRVQLDTDENLHAFAGRTVVVTGTLRGPITASYITAVVVVVDSIAPAPR